MTHYRIADLRTGAFDIVTLDEAAIIAMLDPEVVEWAIEEHALALAWFRRRPGRGLIFHSDRGSQYASGDFQRQLKAFHMRGSMSRKGDCWDNAVTETLFSSLKVERLAGVIYLAAVSVDVELAPQRL
jgi:transposase InsO family protein